MDKESLTEALSFCETHAQVVSLFHQYYLFLPDPNNSLFYGMEADEYLRIAIAVKCELKRTGYSWTADRIKSWLTKCGIPNQYFLEIKALYTLLNHLEQLPTIEEV